MPTSKKPSVAYPAEAIFPFFFAEPPKGEFLKIIISASKVINDGLSK